MNDHPASTDPAAEDAAVALALGCGHKRRQIDAVFRESDEVRAGELINRIEIELELRLRPCWRHRAPRLALAVAQRIGREWQRRWLPVEGAIETGPEQRQAA